MRKVCPSCEGYGTQCNGVDRCGLCDGDGLVAGDLEWCKPQAWPYWEIVFFCVFGFAIAIAIVSF